MRIDRNEAVAALSGWWFTPGKAELEALAQAAPTLHAFLRPAWFHASHADVRFHGFVWDGRLIAAFPMAPRCMGPVRIAEVAGPYWPFRSVLLREDADEAGLLAMMAGREARETLGRLWRLGPAQANDPALTRLLALAGTAGWRVLKRHISHSFDIDVAARKAEKAWPSKSATRQCRNFENRLGRMGAVSYRERTGTDWTEADRDAIAAVEAESWLAAIGDGADTKFLDPGRRTMWEAIAADPVLAPMVFANIMLLDERPIAFTFGLEIGGIRYQIANNFSEEFKEQSPGRIILTRDFADAAARRVPVINWGAGDAGYKARYGAEQGPEIADYLFVDNGLPAILATPLLRRKGYERVV